MGVSVLIVDDEKEFADSLAERLSLRGFSVRAAYSGEEGIDSLGERSVDVVILDLSMPGIGGLETLAQIRSRQGEETEVIVLTGHASVSSAIEGMKRGAFDYLEKPVDMSRLLDTIRRAQDRRARRLERQRMIDTGKLASLAQLAMGVAHELNNPLNIILNETGWIQDLVEGEQFQKCADVNEVKQSVALIAKQIGRCKEITMRLLALRRPRRRGVAKFDLNTLIVKHLEWHQGRVKELGVRVATELAPELPPLAALALELEEVLRHVINNALDAMSKGGGTLTVRTRAETDLVIVEIEDTGRGIPAEVRPHVFEPFYSTKEIGRGHGLGLSISQSIMLNLRGDIEIQSEERKGTRVTLKIPVISPAEGEPQAPAG
jgi:two-component system, NtrC family, sensor kinase